MSIAPKNRSTLSAVVKGGRGLCPNCGKTRLLHHYLKVVDRCPACGEAYGHLRADDAPPWMTILIVGHIVVPIVLIVEQAYQPALWIQFAVWPTVTLALTLALLPRCKGIILAMMWAHDSEGSERA